MSRVIDPERIASGDLDEDEIMYLLQRGVLDVTQLSLDEQEAVRERLDQSGSHPPHYYANTGNVNTSGETIEELERRLARMKAEQGMSGEDGSSPGTAAETMAREVRRQKRRITADDEEPDEDTDDDDVEDDEPEDYSTERGWDNDRRRAELTRRGLSIDGNRDELIARLVADDEAKAEGE